jgi:hypothetical protein
VQTAKISQLEKQIQILENDKAELASQRDLALKEVEGINNQYLKSHYPPYVDLLMWIC